MGKKNKSGFKWRGVATFSLITGMLIEIISGIVLYIVPIGRIANWTNWTLLGLTKQDWAAVHTIFGYFLLIIIGMHLYFNWRIIVHFFWNKVHSAFNLKREFAVAIIVTLLVLVGTIWHVPPFSSVMEVGREVKRSWGGDNAFAQSRGGRWAHASQDVENKNFKQRGNGRWIYASNHSTGVERKGAGAGQGRNGITGDEGYSVRGRGRGRMLNNNSPARFDSWKNYANRAAGTLKGRDIVRLGQTRTLAGTLIKKGEEWELKTEDAIYEIHMGPKMYRESNGLKLTVGANAFVKGFVYENDIAVITIETEGSTVAFRDETGRPAWAGTGFARGAGKSL
jgi:hypothetical protein